MLWITLVLFVVGETIAEIKTRGPCPSLETVKNFVVSRYMGGWYETARYSDSSEVKCVTANYTLREDGSFKIKNRQIGSETHKVSEIDGIASPVHNFGDGKFTIRYLSSEFVMPEQYWVIATDYDNYAVVWYCKKLGEFSFRKSQVLTRIQKPSNAVLVKAYEVTKEAGISRDYVVTDQNNCLESH